MFREDMQNSLSVRNVSTRLRNILINDGSFNSFRDVVEAYKTDPDDLKTHFLRQPWAGKKSWLELKKLIDDELCGLSKTGERLWLTSEDIQRARDALDEAMNHRSIPASLVEDLTTIRKFFDAKVVYVGRL